MTIKMIDRRQVGPDLRGAETKGAQSASPSVLVSIQCLRGVAALMVVVFHSFFHLTKMGRVVGRFDAFAAGVDIFFVISGLIMWITTCRTIPGDPQGFWWRRVQRIVPLYWAMTAASVVIMLLAPHLMPSARFDFWHVLKSFAFIPARHPVDGGWFPVVYVGWTLNFEMLFYVIFTLALAASGRSLILRLGLIAIPLILLSVLPLFVRLTGILSFYASDICLEFGLGTVVAIAMVSGALPRSNLWWGAIAVGSVLLVLSLDQHLVPDSLPRVIRWGIPAFLIVLGAAFLPTRATLFYTRGMAYLGDISYSLYLSHFVAVSAITQFWQRARLTALPDWVFMVSSVAICCAFGALTYHVLERPLAGLVRRGLQLRVVGLRPARR